MKRATIISAIVVILLATSCVKETYDMSRLSESITLSPTWGISAARGSVTLSDLVKTNDTIRFDEENLMLFHFRKDSVIDLELSDMLDLNGLFSLSDSYTIGEVKLANTAITASVTLNQISSNFSPALRAEFLALDDGSPHPFPSFPSTNLGNITLPSFPDFEYVIFSAGTFTVRVTNNLTATLSGVKVELRNASDNSPIGTQVDVPIIYPGTTSVAFIDLTGKTVNSSVIATVILDGSPGNPTPVLIRMSDNVQIELAGTGLEASAGRFVVPEQVLTSEAEMVSFDPGNGMEISEFHLNTGTISYDIQSEVPLTAEVTLNLSTVTRSGTAFSETININPNSGATGTFSADNLMALLNTNVAQPYNSLPLGYNLKVSSLGNMVTFTSTDNIHISVDLPSPDIDWVKGYFGQIVETISPETIDLGLEDMLEKISGEFYFADPSITLDYKNSFGLPVEINLDASGQRGSQNVDLSLNPFTLAYPVYPAASDIEATFTINKDNSSLPSLISLPPSTIFFSGSTKLNPLGNTGARDNYIFGESRFVAGIEASVPMDIRLSSLQFQDTIDNFMKPQSGEDGFSPSELDYVRLDLTVENGFPLSLSVGIVLYDSLTQEHLYELAVPGVIEGAPVDANGVVTGTNSKTSQIVLEKSFFEAAGSAGKMILIFTLNTSGTASQSVKIYSDYSIAFSAGIVVKTDIILN
jgi:hypothetical protein